MRTPWIDSSKTANKEAQLTYRLIIFC